MILVPFFLAGTLDRGTRCLLQSRSNPTLLQNHRLYLTTHIIPLSSFVLFLPLFLFFPSFLPVRTLVLFILLVFQNEK